MSERFTPGVWSRAERSTTVYALDETGTNNRFSVNVQGGYTFRLKFGDGTRTTEAELGANANLIAAAPDLYAALADAESFIARHSGNGETDFRAKLNAVLKRARGES